MSKNKQNSSEDNQKATLYLEGISFDEKGQLLPFTDDMKELITQKYRELQETLPESVSGSEVLSSSIIMATGDALLANNVSEKKVKKFLKRVLEIYEEGGGKKKKGEKNKPKMMEELYKQIDVCQANTQPELFLEYPSSTGKIKLPVSIIVRSGTIDIQHIEHSLKSRLSMYTNILAKKK